MKVYELNACEEYWMQESLGLFVSQEAAIKSLSEQKIMLKYEMDDIIILIVLADEHYSNPDPDKVISRGGEEVTLENCKKYFSSYEFYSVTHQGYDILGIFPREVKE